MTRNRRLQILSEEEISTLYAPPQFDSTARTHYFILPKPVLESLKLVSINKKSTSAKLYFILQYGYFSAKHQFFTIRYEDKSDDMSFIMKTYLPNDLVPYKLPTKKIQTATRRQILKWHGFSDNIKQIDTLVIKKVNDLVKITQNLREIFHETIRALDQAKLVLPNYSRLQDLIGSVLKKEDQRLINSVKLFLTKPIRHALQRLFESGDGLYAITELKLDAKSFQKKEMTTKMNKSDLCKPIYIFAKQFLPQLKLSRRMIDHYADLAKLYSVQRLQRTTQELSYFYVICYIHRRYERLMNNLIQGFIYYVDKYQDDSKAFLKKSTDFA